MSFHRPVRISLWQGGDSKNGHILETRHFLGIAKHGSTWLCGVGVLFVVFLES